MRKILLILDGIVAKDFLTTLTQKHIDKNYYIFVSLNPELLPQNLSEGNEIYNFDPCSPKKLRQILEPQITDCYIITDQVEERELIYKTIRDYNKNIQITLLGELELNEDDKQLTQINEEQILAAKLFERFPNVPRTAKYIGLGEGEIMQINVPFGSPYAYRTVGVIKQKKWKIVAIYRNKELILPKFSTVIFPNDSLLLIGEPKTLWDIYHRIKEEIGQFPTPFGRDVILYFDLLNSHSLEFYLEQTLLLFNHFKNKRLHFCFFNPNTPDIINTLNNNPILQQENITYHIEFYETSLKNILAKDIQNKNIGLILSESFVFEKYKNILFDCGIPLFKFGSTPLEQITHSAVVIPKITEEAEKISSVVFDFSTQLGLKIRLYDFDPDENYHKLAIEYYKHIEKIFEKKIEIIQSNSLNPILWLNQQKDTLQILPLKKERIKKSLWLNLTDIENLSSHLSNLPQLFIPLSV